jgi:hypothetical protein
MIPGDRRRVIGFCVVLWGCCLALGCGNSSKLTQSTYDSIQDGMNLKDVEALLGPGSDRPPSTLTGPALQILQREAVARRRQWKWWVDSNRPSRWIGVAFEEGEVTVKAESEL